MSRFQALTDAQWAVIEPLLPPHRGCGGGGRPLRDSRQVVEGIIYRYRTGIPWRDLPSRYGPWQTVWKRHRRYAADSTWDQILAMLIARADADGLVDWVVSVDSTINRAHQHATNTTRTDTGGTTELQGFLRRTG